MARAVPAPNSSLTALNLIAEAGAASSTVAVTPVKPLLIVSLNRSLRSEGHQLGATIPVRHPGTGCGDFESVTPSVGATKVRFPKMLSSLDSKPPLRMTGFTRGTVFAPILKVPEVVSAYTQPSTAAWASGQVAKRAYSPVRAALAAVAGIII